MKNIELDVEISKEELRSKLDIKDGADGAKGTDGKDGKNGTDGNNGSPDSGKDIVVKINDLPLNSANQIDASHIKNIPLILGGGGGGGSSGSGTPAGSNKQVQYNDNGAFGASSQLNFDLNVNSAGRLMLGGSIDPTAALLGNSGVITFLTETDGVQNTFGGWAASTNDQLICNIAGIRSRGTLASPTTTLDGDILVRVSGFGFGSTNILAPSSGAAAAGMVIRQDGTAGVTFVPGRFEFWTQGSAGGTAVSKLCIKEDGKVGIGTDFVLPLARLMIDGTVDEIQQIIQAHSTQTANLAEWQNSAAGILASFSGTGVFTLGLAGTQTGTINLRGTTSGTVTIQTAAAAGTWTLTLPVNDGDSGDVLSTNGSGVTSWIPQGAGSATSMGRTFMLMGA